MGEKESWPVDRSPAVTVAEASTLGTGQESPPEAAGEQGGSLQSERGAGEASHKLGAMPRPIHDLCKGLNGSGIFQVSGPSGKQQVRLTPGQPLGPEAASGTSATGNDDAVAIGAGAFHATAGENSVPAGWWPPKKRDDGVPGDGTLVSYSGGSASGNLNDGDRTSTVQLRGLPFRATIAGVKAFLGEHAKHLNTVEPAIELVLNPDGRPSGFARVHFTTPQAAQACCEALHRQPISKAACRSTSTSGKCIAHESVSAAPSHAHLDLQIHHFACRKAGATLFATPAVRLHGMPFSMTVQDVLAFFTLHDVADRIADVHNVAQMLPKANGEPSGQAIVQMRSNVDAAIAASKLMNQWIGGRYIEVFVYGDGSEDQDDLTSQLSNLGLAPTAMLGPLGFVGMPPWGTDLGMPSSACTMPLIGPPGFNGMPTWGRELGVPPWVSAMPPSTTKCSVDAGPSWRRW